MSDRALRSARRCTLVGRIVYDRPPKQFRWSDARRIVGRLEDRFADSENEVADAIFVSGVGALWASQQIALRLVRTDTTLPDLFRMWRQITQRLLEAFPEFTDEFGAFGVELIRQLAQSVGLNLE